MPLPNPVIVIPGVTANYLVDEYPLPPDEIWTVLTNDFRRSSLHPDDLRYEAIEPARVKAGQLYEICYGELIKEVRHNLSPSDSEEVPVFPFASDWRQPLEVTEQLLKAFVEEVIARTSLLRHYYGDAAWRANPKVNMVGHSMGGLIIAGYLQTFGAQAKVGKVATLAAPFQGSFEAVIKVTTGTANLGTAAPSSREREAARMTPSLYYLLPSNIEGVDVPQGTSLFDPTVWQPSVVQTIEQYIKDKGRIPDDVPGQARARFAALLQQGQKHRQRIEGLHLSDAGLSPMDWLCVAGADSDTRVCVQIDRDAAGQPQFEFHSADRKNEWPNTFMTGDGTVPLRGAVPKFLQTRNIVVVTPDDYGYWELVDKGLAKTAGFHGMLPNMDMLHRLIVRHFTGAPDTRKNTWGRPLPGVDPKDWLPPLPLDTA